MSNTSTYTTASKVQVVIYLTPEEKEQVKQSALEEQTSSSYYIARLIREHLNNK